MTEITEVAKELLSPLVDTIEVDAMGSVLGVRKATNPDAPTIMLEAHLDEIGFLVTHFDSAGFMYVAPAGGIDGRVLTAQEVPVHASHCRQGWRTSGVDKTRHRSGSDR